MARERGGDCYKWPSQALVIGGAARGLPAPNSGSPFRARVLSRGSTP